MREDAGQLIASWAVYKYIWCRHICGSSEETCTMRKWILGTIILALGCGGFWLTRQVNKVRESAARAH